MPRGRKVKESVLLKHMEDIEDAMEALILNIGRLSSEMSKKNDLKKLLSSIRKEVRGREDLLQSLTSVRESIGDSSTEIEALEGKIEELKNVYGTRGIDEIDKDMGRIRRNINAFEKKALELKEIEMMFNELKMALEEKNREIDESKPEKAKLEKRFTDLQLERDAMEELERISRRAETLRNDIRKANELLESEERVENESDRRKEDLSRIERSLKELDTKSAELEDAKTELGDLMSELEETKGKLKI